MSKDAHQSIVRELTDENSEKQFRIKTLEGKLQALKIQVTLSLHIIAALCNSVATFRFLS